MTLKALPIGKPGVENGTASGFMACGNNENDPKKKTVAIANVPINPSGYSPAILPQGCSDRAMA